MQKLLPIEIRNHQLAPHRSQPRCYCVWLQERAQRRAKMADFFKTKEVRELLKFRKILLIGDSNIRPLYKDLLGVLNQKRLTSIDILKSPDLVSYFGDVAIQQCGKKTTWEFWENRIYEEGGCRVEMFCTGHIVVDVIREFFQKLLEKLSSVPDIVYVSYGPTHWKNRCYLLCDLLSELKIIFPLNTLFIIGSGFRTTTDSFGDPIFDDIPYFTKSNYKIDRQNNKTIVDKISSLGFIFLNNALYLSNCVFRGVSGQPGWESVVVRYTTFLFLTCVARNLLIKVPGRVNQEFLAKAITNNSNDGDEYSLLLMKLTNNWVDLKSKAPLEKRTDPAATNAKEVLEKLWRLYRRSRNDSRSRSDANTPSNEVSERLNTFSNRQLTTIVTSMSPKSTAIDVSDSREDAIASKDKENVNNDYLPAETEQMVGVTGKGSSEMGIDLEEGECDRESLEEGEIRDSPCASRPCSPTEGPTDRQLLSDISSSENEIGDEDDAISVELGTISLPIQLQRNLLTQNSGVSTCSGQRVGLPSTSTSFPNTFTIEISDEETPVEEEEAVITYTSTEDVIINLDSSDSDIEGVTKSIQNNNLSQVAKTAKPNAKRNQRILPSFLDMDGLDLCLKGKNGDSIPWPVYFGTVGGDPLWKWWRTHIEENDNSLIICPKNWPSIHARIPALISKGNLAVPKIIDDVERFLESLKNLQFSEDCLLDCSFTILDDVDEDLNTQLVELAPSVPTAPEISGISEKRFQIPPDGALRPLLPARISEKRVKFQIPPKGASQPSSPVGLSEGRVQFQLPRKGVLKRSEPAGHISICNFASYRQFMSHIAPSASERSTTQQTTSSGAKHQTSSRPSSAHFYAYGENIVLPKATSVTQHWHPLRSWVPTPSKFVRPSSGNHHEKTRGSSYVRQEHSQKSVGDRKRKRGRSRSPRRRDYNSPLRTVHHILPSWYSLHTGTEVSLQPYLEKSKASAKR